MAWNASKGLGVFGPGCRVVAEASASLQTVLDGDLNAWTAPPHYFQGVDNQLALKAACWWSGASCFLLMCWRTRFSEVATGGECLRAAANLSSVLLSLNGFRGDSEGQSVRLPCSWYQPDGARLEQLWSSILTNATITNTLTLQRFPSLCLFQFSFFKHVTREQQVSRDTRDKHFNVRTCLKGH